jgi:hypothetical protein
MKTAILRAGAALAVAMLFAGPVVARTARELEGRGGHAPEADLRVGSVGSMRISEPMTLATDWLLAGAAAFGARLVGTRTRRGHWAPLLWGLAFLVGAGAALAGGAFHGFAATLPASIRAKLWTMALTGSGVAASLLLAGIVLATLGGQWRRCLVVGVAAQLVGCLAVASRGPEVSDVVWNGALTILIILVLAIAGARQEPQRLAWLLLALGLSAASLLIEKTSVCLGPFNHNDLCHVLLTAALWPFYRIGLGLRDYGGPIGGRWPALRMSCFTPVSDPAEALRGA